MKQKITVTKPFLPPKEEYIKLIDEIYINDYLTNNGPIVRRFESELESKLNAKHVSVTCNGHAALDIAIKSLGLKGEVITTPFTFVSTTNAIVLNGLTPVFCDIKESDLTIDEDKIEELITDKTVAIMPVHVYGHICNVEKINQIAETYNLKVIYDASHAFGVNYKKQPIACYGDISTFSFHATKIFNTIEGGALVYQKDEYQRIIKAIRNFGIEGPETVEFIGLNAKMNEFQAAMGLTNLKYISNLINERKKISEYYREKLSKIDGIKYFEPEKTYDDFDYNYAYFPVIVTDKYKLTRDELYEFLIKKDIYSRKYFYPLITDLGCYKNNFNSKATPVAKIISNQILCLPIYNGLKKNEVDYICRMISEGVRICQR